MGKTRVLVLSENLNKFEGAYIVTLSKTDYDNLKLLEKYLPNLNKKVFSDKEREIIDKYNDFIDNIKSKSKSSIITIDTSLKRINIKNS